jgi:hypothetical protein
VVAAEVRLNSVGADPAVETQYVQLWQSSTNGKKISAT